MSLNYYGAVFLISALLFLSAWLIFCFAEMASLTGCKGNHDLSHDCKCIRGRRTAGFGGWNEPPYCKTPGRQAALQRHFPALKCEGRTECLNAMCAGKDIPHRIGAMFS